MTHSKAKNQDTFQIQLTKFNRLLLGGKMAKLSSVILIIVSLSLVYHSRENSINVVILLTGVLGLIFFMDNFLSLKGIKQKTYTHTSLVASISKLKIYMTNRKKYEMYFMSFWMLTLIPSAVIYLESNVKGTLGVIMYIVVVGFFGYLAYKRTDKEIALLETTIENELQLQ
ncbi:hypothetical protein [Lacinutrix salivirga]